MKKIQWVVLLCVFFLLFGCTVIDERYTTKQVRLSPDSESYSSSYPYDAYSHYGAYTYPYSGYYDHAYMMYSSHFWMGLSWMGFGWWNPYWYMYGFWNYYGAFNPWYGGGWFRSTQNSTITKRQLKRPRRIYIPSNAKVGSSKGRPATGIISTGRTRSSSVARSRGGTSSRGSPGGRSSGTKVRKK